MLFYPPKRIILEFEANIFFLILKNEKKNSLNFVHIFKQEEPKARIDQIGS